MEFRVKLAPFHGFYAHFKLALGQLGIVVILPPLKWLDVARQDGCAR
jgi:hypothetical protein